MMWNGPYGMMGGWGWLWPIHFIISAVVLGHHHYRGRAGCAVRDGLGRSPDTAYHDGLRRGASLVRPRRS
jgi:hypothetical protein